MLNASPGPLSILALAVGFIVFAGLVLFSLVSWCENEKRAARRAFLLAWLLAAPFCTAGALDFPYRAHAAGVLLAVTAAFAAVVLAPSRPPKPVVSDAPAGRTDERDTMFSRRDLEPGSERFEAYYGRNPEKKSLDDAFRAKPGLLSEGSLFYDAAIFPAAKANFDAVEALWPLVEGKPSRGKTPLDAGGLSRLVAAWAKRTGAVAVGFTKLEDHHLYSVAGRRERYGQTVGLDHTDAVAIAVEMDRSMVASAPRAPTVLESSQRYLAAGTIAVQIAVFLRELGYEARAHIDGNYLVVCPLVARDAGLGEIGRMGLLMTPDLGPRVRLSVVTTDAPLAGNATRARDASRRATSDAAPDAAGAARRDPTVTDFCLRCKKCASACPSRAIPFDGPREIDGAVRWRIDSEACHTYWCAAGTDCARCIAVCPYAHAGSFVHRIVRQGVRRSAAFRRLALSLDDFFYGKWPPPVDPPEWTRVTPR